MKFLCGILLAAGLLGLFPVSSSAGQWHLGLQGGVNSSGLNGDAPPDTKYGSRTGLVAGAVAEIKMSDDLWISFQPMYIQRGSTSQVAIQGQKDPVDGSDLELDYLGIPILAKIVADNGKIYVTGGFNLGFLLNATVVQPDGSEIAADNLVKSFDVAGDIGVGLMVPIGRPSLNFEFRYEQSILNLSEESSDEEEVNLPARFRSSGFQFLVGLQWPLGGK